jgi:uncharacterized membrane protein YoaK (UPF0700 family)
VGFITMGGVFAANMTGNTVLAGIELAQGHLVAAGRHLTPLVAFFLGAMVARLMLRLLRTPKLGLLVEAAILAAVSFLPVDREVAVLVVALAMGVQASAITQFGGSAVSTVVVTSTLARTADAALDRLWPRQSSDPPAVANPRLLTLTWLGYLAGAVIGALLLQVTLWPLLVPAALLLVALFAG